MKIFAFTDVHGSTNYLANIKNASKETDLIICCGDFTLFGKNQKALLNFMDSWNKTIILTHGNHEDPTELKKMCKKTKNIKYVHNETTIIKGITIIAHGGGGFSPTYPEFDKKMNQFEEAIKNAKKSILITHAPPFGTKLDEIRPGHHVGSISYKKFIEKAQPNIALSGHIHEKFKQTDTIGRTFLSNPGPNGEIIEL